jgi:dTDP-4-amino-4,6-dideoxy-D-galactose acyltransferase
MNFSFVSPYAPRYQSELESIVSAWPFKPLARHANWNASSLFDFAARRVTKALENKNGSAWLMWEGSAARGFACLSLLPWDSEQLGISAARIDYLVAAGPYQEQQHAKNILLQQLLRVAEQEGVAHLSARVDASDAASLHVLEQAGFITVAGLLTFALDLAMHSPVDRKHDFRIRLATAADADAAAALARTAYVHDRFHCDPVINDARADELHATWLRNSCAGEAADAVLVAEDEMGLLGFVTCTVQKDSADLGRLVGTIVLVAAAPAARGRGVGYATTMAALAWFREQGCEIVEVGTQLRNIAASRLYQKCGFRLIGSSLSLRQLLLPINN